MQQNEPIAYPEWTEYRKKNGLDPLGMQTGSVNIYQRLLPGISNVTLRIRYYGLYAWLARTYAKESGDTNPVSWQRFVRRAEALYALVAQHKGHESGVDWASRALEPANGTVIDFAAAAEPGSPDFYLKQAWGAYGAAYASQLYEIGIFAEAKGHTIPVPGEKIGDRAASAFAEGLSSLATPYLAAIHNGKVSRTEPERLAPVTPSEIPENSDERTCYENILFANAGIERPDDIDRRRSLQLLLAVTKQRGRVPGVFDVRWILYAGYDAQNHPLQLPGDELIAQRWRWWVYHANDLLHVCYEGLLKYSLDVLGEYPAGISLSRLIGECTARLIKARDDEADNWKTFRKSHPAPQNCLLPDDQSGEFYLQRELIRRTRPDGVCEAADAMLAVKLLAVLHNRIRSSPKDPADELGKLDRTLVHSLVTELRFLEAHENDSFARFIARLIEERVIRRHLWVGLRKFRYQGDYTFLFETDEGRVRLRAMDGPVFTNPRLGPALTFLKDIHLIDDNGLTTHGKKLAGAT